MATLKSPPATSVNTLHTMQANRGRDTQPEMMLRALLREAGYPGYRLHWPKAPGRPDIAYPGRKVAVFVNGCFWHRCPYCDPPLPRNHRDFWAAKFQATRERDVRKSQELESLGWTVVTVWECRLKADPHGELSRVLVALRG